MLPVSLRRLGIASLTAAALIVAVSFVHAKPERPGDDPKKTEQKKEPPRDVVPFPDIDKLLPPGLDPKQMEAFRKEMEKARIEMQKAMEEMRKNMQGFPGGFPGRFPAFPGGGGFGGGFPG